ncbi:hypothetical protein FKO01_04960 [Mesorhizobium sp. B2-3-3]|nr:hypothetical protein FKO01_04960 [Mesorhizobium sp. B2-3-3]
MFMSTGQMYGNNPAPSPPANPITYINRVVGALSNPGGSPNTLTYANAPIATGASDVVVVGIIRESSFGSTSIGVTVDATAATLWSPGQIGLGGAIGAWIEFYYCQPGALATANIVFSASAAGTGAAIFVWVLNGTTATPLDVVSSAQASSTTVALNDIETEASGAVIALGMCTPTITGWTEAWSGSETVTEDADVTSATGNNRIVACHFATTSALTTQDLTLTLSASQAHIGGAISFGP